jgi:hypothetical protein
MRLVHCRKCYQSNSLLTRQCGRCGNVDAFRFGLHISEVLLYVAGGGIAAMVLAWTVILLL